MSKENKYRFKYEYDSPYGSYWLIQERFLYVFWKKYEEYPYKILKDGSPNTTEVMNYVEELNQNKDEQPR
jgi:hypothetical protein